MQFKPIFRTTDEINCVAESFLASYNSGASIPVPIEEILDNKMEIDIIPLPGLKDSFSRVGLDIDAFISKDFESISVDKHIYDNVPNRYRFSLAHEIGHMYLHAYMYKQFNFESREEWKRLIKSISSGNRNMLERQADEFAGLVLVPRKVLRREFSSAVRQAESMSNVKRSDNPDLINDAIVNHILPNRFKVSASVISIRVERDGVDHPGFDGH